jgi:hypothetical protein
VNCALLPAVFLVVDAVYLLASDVVLREVPTDPDGSANGECEWGVRMGHSAGTHLIENLKRTGMIGSQTSRRSTWGGDLVHNADFNVQ